MTDKIRQFDSGATRDTDAGKLDYEGFLSPLVLKRYAEYLHKHRIQSDGKLRDSDNWQKGIPIKEYMKSKARHFFTTWLWHRDKSVKLNVEESLCAEIFNTMGMLFEVLKAKQEQFVCTAGWVVALESGTGWYVEAIPKEYLHKNLTLHKKDTGWINHMYGEAPGYWPTKEAAEDALQQYLEKQK